MISFFNKLSSKKVTSEPAIGSGGSWSPISLQALNDLIREAEAAMSPAERRLWECLRIQPAKWREATYGDEGGGFWAVGILGGSVLWYNDIEDGFNVSRYSIYGESAEYLCSQDELHHCISRLCRYLNPTVSSGIGPGGSPPERPGRGRPADAPG